MNKIDLLFQETGIKYNYGDVENFCLHVIEELGIDNWEFSLVVSSDDYIKKLNNEYRKKDEATDILTFCNEDENWLPDTVNSESDNNGLIYAGDMIISYDSLKKNALLFNVDEKEEFKRLIIHGILHLAGFEHSTNEKDEEMLIKQEKILKESGDFIF